MRRVLLDTHALLWWRADDPRLTDRGRGMIVESDVEALISAASIWEIAIKRSIGKLEAPEQLIATVEEQGFTWLGITPEHAWAVSGLPDHHGDPFDRLLIAQAMSEGVPVITGDPAFSAYDIEIRW